MWKIYTISLNKQGVLINEGMFTISLYQFQKLGEAWNKLGGQINGAKISYACWKNGEFQWGGNQRTPMHRASWLIGGQIIEVLHILLQESIQNKRRELHS